MSEQKHEPVLTAEIDEILHVQMSAKALNNSKEGKFIDATLGAGGHSLLLLKYGKVLGLDQDQTMLEIARKRIANPNFKSVKSNFIHIQEVAKANDFYPVDAVLFDLGVSQVHFSDSQRGFSFQNPDADLDMRLDPQIQAVKASDLLNSLDKNSLKAIFELTLDERQASKISTKVVEQRNIHNFNTVGDFLETTKFLPSKNGRHSATPAFLALRMAVNSELENIRIALPQALELLVSGGILFVITFHSTEDGLVKSIFNNWQKESLGENLYKQSLVPTQEEVLRNPKARSARLRVFVKK